MYGVYFGQTGVLTIKVYISLRPDEAASVWMPAKTCHNVINVFTLF